jgi:hypothetical protein
MQHGEKMLSPIPNPQSLIPWLLLAACLTGCGKSAKPLPPTYPVHGKVTYKDGTVVHDGFVQFQPAANAWVTTTGAIQRDGTYRPATTCNRLHAEGAVAGPNRVTVVIPFATGRSGQKPVAAMSHPSEPYVFPKPYNIEPRDNELNLVVDLPPPE